MVDWEWEESVIPLSRYVLDIYRGEDPESLELIASGIRADERDSFEDYTPALISKHRTYHYKVVATDTTKNKQVESPLSTWEGNLDFVGLYIVEEHDFLFRYISGTPVCTLKKQTDGQARCDNCWDPIAKRVTKSNCESCHGTGWIGRGVGGYYNPIYTWMDVSPDPEVVQLTQWGRTEPTQTDVFLTNYPRLSVGDIVIELITNKRWKVANIRDTEKRRTKMLQIARLDAINATDIEYTIPIPAEMVNKAQRELNERKQEPEF